MPYDLLEIGPTPAAIRRTLADLSGEAIREAAVALTDCVAWIVPPKTGEGLARLTEVVDDRGVKRPAVELARTLRKGDGSAIPLIAAGYSSPGKLLNSVRTLLKKATDTPRRLFIIAVPDDLFAQILKTAQEPEPDAGTPPVFRGRSGAVLNLLELVAEPAPLRAVFLGHSADAVAVRQLILRAGQVDETVLIGGDTGTGKEIVARQIHENSPRRAYPLRAANCGALPQDLLESELFGHVRGAFTGALTTTDGLWASADGGTLFLDEIGELSPGHQAKLLRALQEHKIRKVGGDVEIPVNARVICASNRDLFAMVQAGQFREDLYYRLRGFLISIPPLREHPEDIPLLVRAFWTRTAGPKAAALPEDIVSALCDYTWPGNVRELKMVLTHLFGLFGQVRPLDVRHLQAVLEMQGLHSGPGCAAATSRQEHLSAFRHLRGVYETVRAVEHLLSPMLNGDRSNLPQSRDISTELARLRNELDLHGRIPRHFRSGTFENLARLRSRVAHFLSERQTSPDAALQSLRDGTREVLDDTVADILADIDRALSEAL